MRTSVPTTGTNSPAVIRTMPHSNATSGEEVVEGLTDLAKTPADQQRECGRSKKGAGEQKDHFEQDPRDEQNCDRQQHRERNHRDAADQTGGDVKPGMTLQPIKTIPRAQREDQEDEQGKKIPGEPPKQPMIGHKGL